MGVATYLDEQIAEWQQELWEKQGETLAVQAWELNGPKEEIRRLQFAKERLVEQSF